MVPSSCSNIAPWKIKYYRGKPSNIDLDIAIGNSGDVQIELICQNDKEPSIYKEAVDAGRVGLHHIGLMPIDYAASEGAVP